MEFRCKDCEFVFKKPVSNKRCPYCGSEKIEKIGSAEEIVKNQ